MLRSGGYNSSVLYHRVTMLKWHYFCARRSHQGAEWQCYNDMRDAKPGVGIDPFR